MQPDHNKQCRKCGRYKPAEDFRPNRHWCSECRYAYLKAYYQTHKEKLSNYQKKYVANNREAVTASKKRYSDEHASEQAERGRRWYAANRDKAIATARKRVLDDPDLRKRYLKEYYERYRDTLADRRHRAYEANKEQYAERVRAWAKANPDSIRTSRVRNKAKRKLAEGSFTATEWSALKRRFNNRCVCCGRKHSKGDPSSKLTADHVVPLARGGTNYISNIQPLCAHCNSSKSAHHTADYRANPFTGIAQLALIS